MPASSHQVTLPSFESLASAQISALPARRWTIEPSWKLPAGSPFVSLTWLCSWLGRNPHAPLPLLAVHVPPQPSPSSNLLSLLNSRLLHSPRSTDYSWPITLLSLPWVAECQAWRCCLWPPLTPPQFNQWGLEPHLTEECDAVTCWCQCWSAVGPGFSCQAQPPVPCLSSCSA